MRYRPKDCLDITIEVEKVRYNGPHYFIANLAYFNRNWQQGNFLINREKSVRVLKTAFRRWELLK